MIFIRYYENLIVDENVDIDIEDIKNMLEEGISVYNLYVICVSPVGNGIMEILNTSNLIKTVNSSKNYGVLAIAKGKKRIYQILIQIIGDWIRDNKDLCFIRRYYNNRCR